MTSINPNSHEQPAIIPGMCVCILGRGSKPGKKLINEFCSYDVINLKEKTFAIKMFSIDFLPP